MDPGRERTRAKRPRPADREGAPVGQGHELVSELLESLDARPRVVGWIVSVGSRDRLQSALVESDGQDGPATKADHVVDPGL